MLEITQDLPSDAAIDRWIAEPVKAALLSTSVFVMNRKGYPVLPKSHQDVVKRLFRVCLSSSSLSLPPSSSSLLLFLLLLSCWWVGQCGGVRCDVWLCL